MAKETLHEMAKRFCDATCDKMMCCECIIDKASGGWPHFCIIKYIANHEKSDAQLDAFFDWGTANPPKPVRTNKDVLLEKFPHAELDITVVPTICIVDLGLGECRLKEGQCTLDLRRECWNRPAPEGM